MKTLEDIGAKFGITRERIRQIQMGALKKLRREMAKRELPAEVEQD
jgi:DNA-directed RNA polymerase sigma subunit (sigma70/sigma32)